MKLFTLLILLAAQFSFAQNEKNEISTQSVGTFADGTSYEVKVMLGGSGSPVEKHMQLIQIKQANGIVCYGIGEYPSGSSTGNPTISCTRP